MVLVAIRYREEYMADIRQQFVVKAPPERVFALVGTPEGLQHWWTKTSSGESRTGAEYILGFGPGYEWRGKVTRFEPGSFFEIAMTKADQDWAATRISFELDSINDGRTLVSFAHTGWPNENEHWKISCYCWAMYLRILRRYAEYGEEVPYEKRLDV